MPERTRAAIYARISVDREESISIDAQVATLRQLCVDRGWTLIEDAIFIDRGFSGKNTHRPAFQAMMTRVRKGEFDVVAAYKLDRVGRSVPDLFNTIDTLEKHHCAFVAASQPFDTSTPAGKLMLTMLAGVAQFERDMISERTRDALANKRKQGGWHGAAPYGYRLKQTDESKRSDGLEIVEAEAHWVREIFKLHLSGKSILSIARLCIEMKAPPTHSATKQWSVNMVCRILKNPVYCGLIRTLRDNGTTLLLDGVHEPIVSRQQWDAAQARFVPGRVYRERKSILPFSIVRCARCGGGCLRQVYTNKQRKRVYSHAYYRCQNASRERTCDALAMRAVDIEGPVFERLAALTRDPQLLDDRIRKAGGEVFRDRDALRALRDRLEREVARLKRDREVVLGRLTDSTISTAFIEEAVRRIDVDIADHERRITEIATEDRRLERVVIDTEFVKAALVQLEEAMRNHTLPPEEMVLLVTAVVERIEIEKGVPPKITLRGRPRPDGRERAPARRRSDRPRSPRQADDPQKAFFPEHQRGTFSHSKT
jgi:site-specific DNA recombinase